MVASGVEKANALLACCRSGIVTALVVTENLAGQMESLHHEGAASPRM
jgi:DNA-binding transcriptional regulator LsrR (DeoR family)